MVAENSTGEIILENQFLKNNLKILTEKFELCNEEVKSLFRKTIQLLEEKLERLENELKLLSGKTLEDLDNMKSL